jgi:ribosomal protein S18 acetylase RimI-like enzyme
LETQPEKYRQRLRGKGAACSDSHQSYWDEERQTGADDRNIREANTADLAQLVTLHQRSFPGFLMTMLGGRFLRVYYEAALECTGTLALIAEEGGRAEGFVVGYVAPQEFYALLRSRRLSLALAAVRGLLLAPGLLPRVLGNLRRLRRFADCSSHAAGGAELASIGVLPAGSGRGLGKALVTEFIRCARTSAVEYVYLTTDAVDNDNVNGFYCGLGFVRSNTFLVPGGRLMNEYTLPLENRAQ